MTKEPVTVESVAELSMANTHVLGQAASIIGAQNCIIRALLRALAETEPDLLERVVALAGPDLAACEPGVADAFAAILQGVGEEEEEEVGH